MEHQEPVALGDLLTRWQAAGIARRMSDVAGTPLVCVPDPVVVVVGAVLLASSPGPT